METAIIRPDTFTALWMAGVTGLLYGIWWKLMFTSPPR